LSQRKRNQQPRQSLFKSENSFNLIIGMFAPACKMAGDLPIQKNLDAFTKTIYIS
jgi:hypothetical protein